jgi:bacterioferritin
MSIRNASEGILSDAKRDQRDELVGLLQKAYWMEIETVMSYIANSVNPDGVRAQEIIESLEQDIQEELGHAQQFAQRIKELYGSSRLADFQAEQTYLQPPEHQTDIVHVIKGVIEAETGAIEHYNRIIEFDRRRRLRDPGHGHRDPPRRGGPPAPLRGLSAGVRGRGPRLTPMFRTGP